jgi:TIR domain
VARVFISHSSADMTLAAQVHRWLVDDGHNVFLNQDLGDGIEIRDVWEKRLQERLRQPDAMVCMPTAEYVASTWCTAELVIAQSRGSRLLPIHAESGVRHPVLTELQEITERLPARI